MTINSKQVEEMAGDVISAAIRANAIIDRSVAIHLKEFINNLYNAGYRKAEEVRKETAKEILQRVVTLCENEEDFQDGHVNTQLEPLFFGIANGCNFIKGEVKKLAKEYGVEVEEWQ